MTVATIFSSLGTNQNMFGVQALPNAIVNAGSVVDRAVATLTVVPSTGWAEATFMDSVDGVSFVGRESVYVAPNSGGTANSAGNRFPGYQYFTAVLTNVSPGAVATLTVTY